MKIQRKRVQFKSDKPSLTQQNMKDECDVNSILDRYRKTGMINHIRNSPGQYGDFSTFQDFKTNLDAVKDAYAQFESLPAHLRKRFANDPANLVEFVMDNENYDEAVKLGLVPEKAPAQKQKPAQNDDKTTINQPDNQGAAQDV